VKPAEVRDLTDIELSKKLIDLKKELFALRFQHAVNQLENPQRLPMVKKDIARVKTTIRERELKTKEGGEV
jgi:large subunit ribosomal protein L29